MRSIIRLAVPLAALLATAAPSAAQQSAAYGSTASDAVSAPKATVVDDSAEKATSEAEQESAWKKGRPIVIQYYRPMDKRGINVFETTKDPGAKFEGFKLDFGAAFTSQLQDLTHSNTAAPSMVSVRLCGRICSRGQPIRLPSSSTSTRAATPALMWTAVPPA